MSEWLNLPIVLKEAALRDRYLALIDEIVETTLKGQIRSKEQVYQRLVKEIEAGTGEIFEYCLEERYDASQTQVKAATDDLKKAKAERVLRALKTIQGEWARYQKDHQATSAIASLVQAILTGAADERILVLLRAIDINQPNSLSLDQLKQLAKALEQSPTLTTNPELRQDILPIATGIHNGLVTWGRLEGNLISWMYDQSRPIGFVGGGGQQGPWELWAKQTNSPLLKNLLQALGQNQSVTELMSRQTEVNLADWLELAIALQYTQRGLVVWFEKQPYDSKWGTKQAISTFLSFAVIWSQLSSGVSLATTIPTADRNQLTNGCFQVMLQILREFSQRPYFPLYGGIFALFSNSSLRETFTYLNEPLRQVDGTQAKARILTLFGYSHRATGQYGQAMVFHQQALEIAQTAGDRPCAIANLNHLSRTCIAERHFQEAINYSQRALIQARQSGDRVGEANALTNLGYSEVLLAREQESVDPDVYDAAINYLKQGLHLLERSGDSPLDEYTIRQSQALCYNSLGIAHVILRQFQLALPYLENGVVAALYAGDLYLQGVNYRFLAEVCYALEQRDRAILTGCLGMYLLEQVESEEWKQPAALLTILQGQLGETGFQQALQQQRSQIIPVIGFDGYDHVSTLLEQYRRSLD